MFVSLEKFYYHSVPDEALMDMFIETVDVHKTVSQLLWKGCVFIAILVMVSLNPAHLLHLSYNNNLKGINQNETNNNKTETKLFKHKLNWNKQTN